MIRGCLWITSFFNIERGKRLYMTNEQALRNWDTAPDVLSVMEAKTLLNIGKTKMYELCYVPGFPKLQFGKQIKIPKDKLREFVYEKYLNIDE